MSIDSKLEPELAKPKPRKPSLKINAISNWGPLAVNFIVGLLLTPYLIGHLGKGSYGVWALVGSLLGYYGLLRLGVGAGIMRYVPFYRGANDNRAASQILSTAMAMSLIVGLAILLISVMLAEPIARFYKAGSELASLIRILGVAAAIECPMRILDTCIRSHEHWVAANLAIIFTAITRALGLAGCIYLGYGVVQMGYVVLAVTILSLAFFAVLFIQFCSKIRLRPSMIKLSHAQMLLSFGILTTIISLAYTLTLQGHSLIIGKVISLDAVAVYAIPVLLIRNIRQGVLAPVRVFWPRFAYLDGKNDLNEVTSLFLRGTRLSAMFASGVMLIVFVVGHPFIRLWMVGEDFSAAYPVLLLLAGGYLVEGSQAVMPFLLGGTGRQGIQAIFAAAEGILGIGLSIILTWQLGLVGVAFGFVIGIVLMRGIVCPWYVCHLLHINLLRYYTTRLLRPLLVLGTLTLISYALGISELIDGWLALISAVMIAGIVYLCCTYLFVIRPDERRNLKNYLGKKIGRLNVW